MFKGLPKEVGNGVMRGFAELARTIGFAGEPIVQALSGNNQDVVDSYFKHLDNFVGSALDYWKTQPGTTGTGAQIAGDVATMAAPMLTGPAAGVAMTTNAFVNSAADSIKDNQDAMTAVKLGLINAASTAAGMKLPMKFPKLWQRLAAGVGGNIVLNKTTEALTKQILEDNDYQQAAQQIDLSDPKSFIESGLMGAIFGAVAGKPGAKSEAPAPTAEPATAAQPTPIDLGTPVTAPGNTPGLKATEPSATPAPTAEGAGSPAQVPDQPSAEPVHDLKAQVADMKDANTPRKGVYLSSDNVAQLGPKGVAELADGAKQIRNFDKKGGIMLVPDVDTARAARDLKAKEPDMQKVIGQLTGAGDGKAPDQTAVVQGQTPEGAVATETAVAPHEVPAAVAEAQAQGKTPVVTTPEEAVARRAALVNKAPETAVEPPAAEPAPTAEPVAAEAPAPAGFVAATPEELAAHTADVQRPLAERMAEKAPVTDKTEVSATKDTTPKADKAKAKSALDQLPAALDSISAQEKAPKGKAFPAKLQERQENAAAFGAALKAAANDARGKVDDAAVDRANKAAKEALVLAGKTAEATAKGQGTGHMRVTAIVAEMKRSARGLLGTAEPGDDERVPTRAAVLKERVAKRKAKTAESVDQKEEDQQRIKQLVRETEHTPETAAEIDKIVGGERWRKSGLAEDIEQSALEALDRKYAKAKPTPEPSRPSSEPSIKPTDDNVITVKPHIIRGREMEALVKEVGGDPASLAAEAEKATGNRKGALMGYLQELANGMDPNKGWLAHMSALNPERSKASPLNRGMHIQLKNLIKRFAIAKPEEAGHARDALENFMNHIDGKRLDDRTQAAVHEYAQARRRMEVLKDKFGEDETHSEETVYDEHEHNGDDAHDEAPKGWDRISGGVTEEPQDQWKGMHEALLNTRTASGHNFYEELAARKGQFVSTKAVLDTLHNVASANGIGDHITGVIDLLRQHAPDLPIKMVDTIISPTTGKEFGHAGGMFHGGTMTMQAKVPSHASPTFIRTVLHEITHAATVLEMANNPEGYLSKKLADLHAEARDLAVEKYGAKTMKDHMDYWRTGVVPEGLAPRRELYGLMNPKEMLAEAFTNPAFHEVLNQLDNEGRTGIRMNDASDRLGYSTDPVPSKGLLGRIVDAVTSFFNPKGDRETGLLRDIIQTGGELMSQQKQSFKSAEGKTASDFLAELASKPNFLLGDGHDKQLESHLLALKEEPPPIRGEEQIMRGVPDSMRGPMRSFSHVTKTKAWDSLSKVLPAWSSLDQLVRRRSRFFGNPHDDTNPLRQYSEVRAERDTVQNKIVDKVTPAAEAWQRLTPAQDRRVGQMMIDTTTYGIDPTIAKEAHSKSTQRQRGYDARYAEFQSRWNNLTPAERDVYTGAREANKYVLQQQKKAAVNVAIRGFADQLTDAQREQLYRVKSPEQFDALIGEGKPINVHEDNAKLVDSLKEIAGLHEMNDPYFHLGRDGSKVVQVKPEGTKEFSSEAEAQAFADKVHALGPASSASMVEGEHGKWSVDYEAHYVSMHGSAAEAETDAQRMRDHGFEVGPVTEKTFSRENAPLTEGVKQLVAEAERRINSYGEDDTTTAMTQALRASFVQMIAQRSAFASSRLARKGVGGVKAEEMRLNFARHVQSSAWHTGNLSTVFQEAGALGKMREAARASDIDQKTAYSRGVVVHEINSRIQQEVAQYGLKQPFNSTLAKVGFLNFLTSPSHALIWLTQNFTTGIPVAGAKYGYGRTIAAFTRGMSSPAMPALRATMKGVFQKPWGGRVTTADVTRAFVEAVRQDPKMAKWAKGDNSHIQQLMDRGAIASTLANELGTIAQGNNATVAKTFDWLRVLPHMADAYNRLSTALAGLELTNGHVGKTADLVREIHIDYGSSNKPRAFKTVGRLPGGNSITMMKTYVQGMAHLMYSNIYDSITGEGKSRAEAAKTLAGMMIGTAVFAGVLKTIPEPVRLLAYAYNKIFGDDDQYYSLDNSVRRWLTDAMGETAGRLAAGGLPRAAGFDLSSRMGLSDLFFHDPPDLLSASKDQWMAFAGEQLGAGFQMGPEMMQDFRGHMARGEPFQAAASLVPVKMLHDATKAYTMMTRGRQTSTGGQVIKPENYSSMDAVYQTLGLKPAKTADIQERQGTVYDYKNWANGRKQALIADYGTAAKDDKGAVMQKIAEWNKANPGVRITRSDLIRLGRSQQRAAGLGQGAPDRDPNVNRLMRY